MANLNRLEQLKIFCSPDLDSETIEKIVKNLSAVALSHQGKYLWLGTDEGTAIERFTRLDDGTFAKHKRFYFQDFINNFDEKKGEVDVEGLDYQDGYLWIVGSHSSKRKKVKIEKDNFQVKGKELKEVERQENRYLLARIPVTEAGELEASSTERAWLKQDGSNNTLTLALKQDEYLNLTQRIAGDDRGIVSNQVDYLSLPSKENGFDVEGLAVVGNRICIGLRGPVLRGIAILLEIEVEAGPANQLLLKPIGEEGRLYKRHFLDLDGLGLRELSWDKASQSLLILAGPTMDLDGSHSLFCLEQPFMLKDNSLSSQKNHQLQYLGEIPHGQKTDRAEGLAHFEQGQSVLIVYDSPAKERLIIKGAENIVGVYADILSLA